MYSQTLESGIVNIDITPDPLAPRIGDVYESPTHRVVVNDIYSDGEGAWVRCYINGSPLFSTYKEGTLHLFLESIPGITPVGRIRGLP